MKQWLIIAGVSVALAACGGDDNDKQEAKAPDATKTVVSAQKEVVKTPVTVDASKMQALSDEARSAVQSLGGTLQGALKKAMKNS